MFLDPGQDICEIEKRSILCANRMRKRLEGEGAEIER